MDGILKRNIEYSNNFFQKVEGSVVPSMIKNLLNKKKIKKIIDLGCGDGGIINAISKKYKDKKITGVDISPRRIKTLKQKFPKYDFYCKDVCSTKLKKSSFDLIICTQVIEHIENDKKLLKEIYRILKKNGYLYISSVLKKPWAIYKYRNRHGKFALDPTHEYEYKSKEEFTNLFRRKFKLLKLLVFPVKRKKIITFKIPGYYIIESLWKKI